MEKFYTPKEDELMKIVFFFSGGASSMRAVLESPEHGKLYKVVAAITNRPEKKAPVGWDIARNYDIGPFFINPSRYETRGAFYIHVTSTLDLLGPDVIGLSGWLKKYSIISDPLISVPRYKDKIANVHPANLAILAPLEGGSPWNSMRRMQIMNKSRDFGGEEPEQVKKLIESGWERLYTGDDAVSMAAFFGEEDTCSTIHVVEEKVDGGKILVQSERKPIDAEYIERKLNRNALGDIVEYAHKLQGEMKDECDGPAFKKFLELAATGRLGIEDDAVFLDEEPLTYGGYQM